MSETTSLSATLTATVSATTTAAASSAKDQPASFKIIGVVLAVGSGLFIGSSFVFKKKGLLSSQAKAGTTAGEGHAYLKSPMWWTGMILMIVGEILNFVAYAFTDAILVTPLGALSVVICAILSSIFLKEKLTFFGKIGCFLCIVGAIVIALNGPKEQSVTTIKEFKDLFLSVGFLVWGSILIVSSLVLIFFVAPRWGKKNMLVYILVCSLIGGLSVSSTQGLGASILTSIRGDNQFKNPFIYFLLGFVIITLLTEINYLNKALELFNTAMVTPTYYVIFTFSTLITSVILYQGFKAPVTDIITVVLGFLVICAGITLLQLSKIDSQTIASNLDRKSTLLIKAAKAEVKPEGVSEDELNEKLIGLEDPGVDSIRGSFGAIGSIHRAISQRRMSRRVSQASSTVRQRAGRSQTGNSMYGLNDVPRYQLYDNPTPMPEDATARISMYTSGTAPPSNYSAEEGRSRAGTFGMVSPEAGRERSMSIHFADRDVQHRYAPGKGGQAIHGTIQRRFEDNSRDVITVQEEKENEDSLSKGEFLDPPFTAPTGFSIPYMQDEPYEPFEDRKIRSAALPKQTQTIAQMLKRQFSASSPDLKPRELKDGSLGDEDHNDGRVGTKSERGRTDSDNSSVAHSVGGGLRSKLHFGGGTGRKGRGDEVEKEGEGLLSRAGEPSEERESAEESPPFTPEMEKKDLKKDNEVY